MDKEKITETIQRNISGMLTRTKEKAKVYEGDPFREYRKGVILPEKFEYGMNCFLDRIAEIDGEKLAQKVYEEIRSDPRTYAIREDTSVVDVHEIPVLFGITSTAVAMDAHTKAVGKRRIEIEYRLNEIDRELRSIDEKPTYELLGKEPKSHILDLSFETYLTSDSKTSGRNDPTLFYGKL